MTPKQAIFYGEYIKDSNGTRAAIAAGFPERSAHVAAARMLRNAKVSAAIEAWRKRRCEKLEITAERVLEEIAKLAFYDPGDLFDGGGNLKPLTELDDVTRAAIAGMDVETLTCKGDSPSLRTMVKKIKLVDKGQNLERLGRYLKLFTDRVEHDGRVTLEQLVCGSYERDEEGKGGGSAEDQGVA